MPHLTTPIQSRNPIKPSSLYKSWGSSTPLRVSLGLVEHTHFFFLGLTGW
ncbi:hypothetical protein HBH56_165440 [Parastagonospora nodorum]|uniref:Uncharacterized protein n=1 Tax=Phaeosphaeria nodorum (strain SN15 / ATCC MYA-4574 / FGSC 10173) TaxID=321614 RepID=A0A7U2I1M4_PHANO|nr:hypothetical protein HBH56_165440 [Parastagonospora nodorum]QRC98489.1 hypothetical protein JI435_412140 [Parastagonospora nodorum SN15]KAH3936632.1 hypothetical protein HBH54_028530 [Parastagonospora nodorum]KAH4026099.1 hypothetical protein HBI09_148310 [Parastagonospora nodorum]KAH4076749.1 hypothetical protein HBH50_009830 [Parastagonospora nodorum]